MRGDNTLRSGAGADKLDGQGGFDDASYHTSAAAVVASLAIPASNTGDTYAAIEGLSGSRFDDALTGDAANNWLIGQATGRGGFEASSRAETYLLVKLFRGFHREGPKLKFHDTFPHTLC